MSIIQVRNTESTPGEQREFASQLAGHFDNLFGHALNVGDLCAALRDAGLGLFEVNDL